MLLVLDAHFYPNFQLYDWQDWAPHQHAPAALGCGENFKYHICIMATFIVVLVGVQYGKILVIKMWSFCWVEFDSKKCSQSFKNYAYFLVHRNLWPMVKILAQLDRWFNSSEVFFGVFVPHCFCDTCFILITWQTLSEHYYLDTVANYRG